MRRFGNRGARLPKRLYIRLLADFLKATEFFHQNTVLAAIFDAVHQCIGEFDCLVQSWRCLSENGDADAYIRKRGLHQADTT